MRYQNEIEVILKISEELGGKLLSNIMYFKPFMGGNLEKQ